MKNFNEAIKIIQIISRRQIFDIFLLHSHFKCKLSTFLSHDDDDNWGFWKGKTIRNLILFSWQFPSAPKTFFFFVRYDNFHNNQCLGIFKLFFLFYFYFLLTLKWWKQKYFFPLDEEREEKFYFDSYFVILSLGNVTLWQLMLRNENCGIFYSSDTCFFMTFQLNCCCFSVFCLLLKLLWISPHGKSLN